MARDGPVHDRLRERGVVELVVTVAAETHQVHEHVALEAHPVLDRERGGLERSLRVVGVDVEHRRVLDARDVGGVARRPHVLGRGRETDLVVDDQVERAADLVRPQLRERERLRDDALAGEPRIAVEEHREAAAAGRVAHVILARAHRPEHHRVHELEVAGVEVEIQVERTTAAGGVGAGIAHVVLDVAVPLDVLGQEAGLELAEDRLEGLAQDVGQHVEPPAVRHADDDLLGAGAGRDLDQRVEHRDERRGALEREALLARVAQVEELLEAVRHQELPQDAEPILGRKLRPVAGRLHPLLQPLAPLGVGDPHVLDPERATVGLGEGGDEAPEGAPELALEGGGGDRPRVIGRIEAQRPGVEERRAFGLAAERVEPRAQVALDPIVLDQP